MGKRLQKMFHSGGCLGIVLLIVSNITLADLDKQFSYTTLWGSAMPGNVSSTFNDFSPPIIDTQMVAFFGEGTNNYQAIFSTRSGYLKAEVSNSRELPLGAGTLSNFLGPARFETSAESEHHKLTLSAMGNGLTFMATGADNKPAIYRIGSQSLHTVANKQTPVPKGKGQFAKLGTPKMLNNQCVAFWGQGTQQQSLFLSNSKGHLHPLITAGTQLGSKDHKHTIKRLGSFDFGFRPQSCDDALKYTFVGYDQRGDPILYQTKQGQTKQLVDSSVSIPGNYVGFFTEIKQLSYDQQKDRIVFVGHGVIDQQGLFWIDQGQLKPLVTQDTVLPESPGTFQTFSHPNLIGHNVVFQATGGNDIQGIYLANTAGEQFKILTNQDKLNGNKIESIYISQQAFLGKRVVMLVEFQNGHKGIFTAKLQSTAF